MCNEERTVGMSKAMKLQMLVEAKGVFVYKFVEHEKKILGSKWQEMIARRTLRYVKTYSQVSSLSSQLLSAGMLSYRQYYCNTYIAAVLFLL